MWDKILLLFPLTAGILPLTSFTSAEPRYHLPPDYTQADGFIFEGSAGRPSGPNINDNPLGSTIDPYTKTQYYFGRRKLPVLHNTFPKCFRNCPTSPEKKPVCGNDGVTYDNAKQVHCARMCGKFVQIDFEGPCNHGTTTTPSSITTTTESTIFKLCTNICPKLQHYSPVCATDGVTYNNTEFLKCAQICGKSVKAAFFGVCSNKVIGRPQG